MTDIELIKILKVKFGSAKLSNKGWVMIRCPTCTPKDARKCRRGVHLRTLATKCWICETPTTIQELLVGLKLTEVIDTGMMGDEDADEHPQARIIPCSNILPLSELPADHPAVKFMLKDGLPDFDKYWNDHKIGWIDEQYAQDVIYTHDDEPDTKVGTKNSIVFPVYYKKELVGWQLRFIPGSKKFRYFHIFKKGNYLFNYDNAINYQSVVVTEGVKKALKFDNGVATWGKSISEEQIRLLVNNWRVIVFLYDGGKETQKEASQLAKTLNVGSMRCINIDPMKYGYPSPDEMSAEIAQKIVYFECKMNGLIDEA